MMESEQDPGKTEMSSKPHWLVSWILDKPLMLIIGLALGSWWNTAAPSLHYSPGEVITFSGEKEEFGIFVTTITNNGRKKADQVECQIELSDSRIEDLKVSPSNLHSKWEVQSDGMKATISVPSLNAGETLEVAVKTNNPRQAALSRRVFVRGSDVIGVMGNSSQITFSGVFVTVLFGTLALFSFVWMIGKCLDLFERIQSYFMLRNERNNPKKRFVFRNGKARGTTIGGEEAAKLYSGMSMQQTRLDFEGSRYKVLDRRTDDDGTIEFSMYDD